MLQKLTGSLIEDIAPLTLSWSAVRETGDPTCASLGSRRGISIRGVSLHGVLDLIGIRARVCSLENHDVGGRGVGVTQEDGAIRLTQVPRSTSLKPDPCGQFAEARVLAQRKVAGFDL
jgi:hypothetical protein